MKTFGMWMLGFCLTLGTISMVGCSDEAETPPATPPADTDMDTDADGADEDAEVAE